MESIRRKIVSLINSGSNKVCVASLTKFYNFLKLVNLISFLREKIKKNKKVKNANDQNFFNFVGGGLRQRVIR